MLWCMCELVCMLYVGRMLLKESPEFFMEAWNTSGEVHSHSAREENIFSHQPLFYVRFYVLIVFLSVCACTHLRVSMQTQVSGKGKKRKLTYVKMIRYNIHYTVDGQ